MLAFPHAGALPNPAAVEAEVAAEMQAVKDALMRETLSQMGTNFGQDALTYYSLERNKNALKAQLARTKKELQSARDKLQSAEEMLTARAGSMVAACKSLSAGQDPVADIRRHLQKHLPTAAPLFTRLHKS